MNMQSDNKNFTIYRYEDAQNNLFAAIPVEYNSFIEQSISEYGAIANVPAERTVRGIFITGSAGTFDPGSEQSDITINCLQTLQ
jgi:hypothetical protein